MKINNQHAKRLLNGANPNMVEGVVLAKKVSSGLTPAYLAAYDLKKRNCISVTSMCHEVAFLMSNMASVKKGDAVLDPYAGSCGILLASAAFGAAKTVGIEIRSWPEEDEIRENYRERGLPFGAEALSVVRGDCMDEAVQIRALKALPSEAPSLLFAQHTN